MVKCKKEIVLEIQKLGKLAYKLTGDQERAKDLVQEVYIIAHNYIDGGGQIKNLKNWLRQVMTNLNKNVSRDYMTEHRNLQSITDDLLINEVNYNQGLLECQQADLDHYSSRLPHLQKKAFRAFTLGYTYDEISKELNVSNDSVRRLISQCRKRLTRQLEIR